MSLQDTRDWFQILSSMAVILGIPWAIFQHRRAIRREQRDRERGTYDALDDKYVEYQRLCLAHPNLDVFDIPLPAGTSLSDAEKKQELIVFTVLMTIFERAYLMYADQSTAIKQRQWSGWDEYIQSFCRRENFRKAWEISGKTFDTDFQRYMEGNMRNFAKGA